MTTFQPGQKVRYTGKQFTGDDPARGAIGAVVQAYESDRGATYVVDFGLGETYAFESELEEAS